MPEYSKFKKLFLQTLKQLDSLITADIIDISEENLKLIDSCCALILDASKNFYDKSDYFEENTGILFSNLTFRLNSFIDSQITNHLIIPNESPHLAHVIYIELTSILEEDIFDAFYVFFLMKFLRKIILDELQERNQVSLGKEYQSKKKGMITKNMKQFLMKDLEFLFDDGHKLDMDKLNKGCDSV